MRSQFGSIPSLIHELTSLVLLVSFMARWDAAHGQHYGSTFWKSGVGWNKEVPRQRVCRRGNHQQWAWVIINSEWLVGKLFSFAVMHDQWDSYAVYASNRSKRWKWGLVVGWGVSACFPFLMVLWFYVFCPSHFLIWALWKCSFETNLWPTAWGLF